MANNLNFGGAGGIKLTGVDDIQANIREVGTSIATRLSKKALKAALAPVEARAKALAPVGKGPLGGLLRDSIGTKTTSKKGTDRGVVGVYHRRIRVGTRKRGKNKGKAIIKDPARYAHLQEFGTKHAAAHPFLRPAWQSEGGETALNNYKETLRTDLAKVVKKLRKTRART